MNELENMNLDDLIVERVLLRFLKETIYIIEVQVINALKRGNLAKALQGNNTEQWIKQQIQDPKFRDARSQRGEDDRDGQRIFKRREESSGSRYRDRWAIQVSSKILSTK